MPQWWEHVDDCDYDHAREMRESRESRYWQRITHRSPSTTKYTAKNLETQEVVEDLDLFDEYYSLYTHDQIPVRKILIANISSSTTCKNLIKEFKGYGKIIDCILKKKSSQKSYAFITFEESQSAYKAIYEGYYRNIRIDQQYLRVLPASAWHQPDANKYADVTSNKLADLDQLSAYNSYLLNDESPITKLNEDCLLHIFGFLTLKDGIKIQKVCRYWQIVSIRSLILYKKFDSLLSLENKGYIKNAPTLYKILKTFGSYVTKANDLNRFSVLGNSSLIAIAELCPNLEEIDLNNFPFLASGIEALAKNSTKLKRISIGPSSHKFKKNELFDKELSHLFLKNRNIQYVKFKDKIINGSCLKHLSTKYITHISLEELDCSLYIQMILKINNLFTLEIHRCVNAEKLLQAYIQGYKGLKLNSENIEKLTITDLPAGIQECKINNFFKSCNLRSLKYLKLTSIKFVSDEFLLALSENCNQLTYIDISGLKGLTDNGLIYIVSSLSKLEHLCMTHMSSTQVSDNIFYGGMPNLKTLNCSYCSGMQDEGLIKLINNSEKLENLVVTGCHLITNKLIHDVIEYTKHKKNKIQLTIDVSDTKVDLKLSDLKYDSRFLQIFNKPE